MIKLENVSVTLGGHKILKNVHLEVKKGEVLSLIGPSGSGKSTLLRSINFLVPTSSGEVFLMGRPYNEALAKKEKVNRQIGMVFQQFNLFPHMNVLENIIYAPTKVFGVKRTDAIEQAKKLLTQVDLLDKIESFPHELSGGQKQRVAIARALINNPKIMLFDEPTSALDPEMVKEVLSVIQDLAKNTDLTILLVTHEMNFAKEVADQVVFMDQGQVLEVTPTKSFFSTPSTERAKEFLAKVL